MGMSSMSAGARLAVGDSCLKLGGFMTARVQLAVGGP